MRKSRFRSVLCGASALALLTTSVWAQDASGDLAPPVLPLQDVAPERDGADSATLQTDLPGGTVPFDGFVAGPAAADETAPETAVNNLDLVAPVTGEVQISDVQTDAAEIARVLPDDMDPMSRDLVLELDTIGYIKNRSDISLRIKLMEDNLRKTQSAIGLIEILGVEGFKAAYPDLYDSLKDSPAILTAQIKQQELLNALQEMQDATNRREEGEAKAAAALMPREDGSDFFKMPLPDAEGELIDEAADTVPAPIDPGTALLGDDLAPELAVPVIPEPVDTPISLREIYGINGDHYAIITLGVEKVRVSSGDVLPGDTVIKAVGDDYIDVIRRGTEIRIHIQG